jgi:hypothetical protein
LSVLFAAPAAGQDEGTKVYKQVVRSVVWVHSPRDRGLAMGSGTLVDLDRRLILTNYHVVEDENRARVFFPAFRNERVISEKSYYTARIKQLAIRGRVVARDKTADLALIQIDSVPEGVKPIPLAAESAEPGQAVHSIGHAGASDALWGYVPGKVRQVYRKKWRAALDKQRTLVFEARVVETDSPTNHGDSGGPLVNDKGELVGVTEGADEGARLVSTFIDVSEVRRFLAREDVRSVRADKPKPEAPRREIALPIRDDAKLFGDDAKKKAQAAIDELFAKYKLDVLVETYPSVREADLEKVKKMSANERKEYMRTWARSRVASEHVTGFVILISNEPKLYYVDQTNDTNKDFPADFEKKVIEKVTAGLKAKKFDDMLADVVALIVDNRGKR